MNYLTKRAPHETEQRLSPPSCSTPPPGPALRDWHARALPGRPMMPRIANFTDVSNMGVVLLSCTTRSGITKAKRIFSCFPLRKPVSTGREAQVRCWERPGGLLKYYSYPA